MKKVLAGFMLLFVLTGCGKGANQAQELPIDQQPAKRAAGLLAPNDQPGAIGNEGLKQALNRVRDEQGFRIDILEPNEFRTLRESLAYLAENGYSLIMTTDNRAEADIPNLTAAYPNTSFVLLNRQNPTAKEDSSYQLIGYLAAAKSVNDRFGILYDPTTIAFNSPMEGAFQAGVNRLLQSQGKVSSFVPALAAGLVDVQSQALALKNQGVDTLLVLGGTTYLEEAYKGFQSGGGTGTLVALSRGESTLTPGYIYLEIPQTSGVEAAGVINQFIQGNKPEVPANPQTKQPVQAFQVGVGGERTPIEKETMDKLLEIQQTLP